MPKITFLPEKITLTVARGTTILQAAKEARLEVITDCEFGWCGTNPFVIVEGGENVSPPEEDERENLTMNHFPPKVRMACVTPIHGDIVVERYN